MTPEFKSALLSRIENEHQAVAFLILLGMSEWAFHLDDNIHDIIWSDTDQPPTPDEMRILHFNVTCARTQIGSDYAVWNIYSFALKAAGKQ